MAYPSDTFKVFVYILSRCGADGISRTSPPGISSHCYLPPDVVRKAIKALESPDPDSRSKAEKGRRIRRVDGGYFVVNYSKYRERGYSQKDSAVRMRRKREKEKEKGKIKTQDAQDPKTSVDCFPSSNRSRREAEATCSHNVTPCQEKGIYFNGSEWTGLTPDVFESLREKYPAKDIRMELEKMAKWFRAVPARINPKIERTEFIEKWLRRPIYESQRREG